MWGGWASNNASHHLCPHPLKLKTEHFVNSVYYTLHKLRCQHLTGQRANNFCLIFAWCPKCVVRAQRVNVKLFSSKTLAWGRLSRSSSSVSVKWRREDDLAESRDEVALDVKIAPGTDVSIEQMPWQYPFHPCSHGSSSFLSWGQKVDDSKRCSSTRSGWPGCLIRNFLSQEKEEVVCTGDTEAWGDSLSPSVNRE